jgi:hypothetical protein
MIKPRRMRWVGHIVQNGEGGKKNPCRILVAKPEGKTSSKAET